MNTTEVLDKALTIFDKILIAIFGRTETIEYFGRYRGYRLYLGGSSEDTTYFGGKVRRGREYCYFTDGSRDKVLQAMKEYVDRVEDNVASIGVRAHRLFRMGVIIYFLSLAAFGVLALLPWTKDDPVKYFAMLTCALGFAASIAGMYYLIEDISIIRRSVLNIFVSGVSWGTLWLFIYLISYLINFDIGYSFIDFEILAILIGTFNGAMSAVPVEEMMKIIHKRI